MMILELFSGYGTATFALKRLGIPHKIVGYSDIDKYANQCFQQNHGGKELGDVREINPNELEDFDLLTGGFPCQSFSVAGKGLGEADPRGTLFAEIIRMAEAKQPKYMLLENVKGLTNKNHKKTFEKILKELDRIGYNVYWKVLNSKDFGIPQSRARVWFVCFRKDIEHNFKWPEPVELKIFIKDILEDEVEDKYYLSEKLQKRFEKYLNDKYRVCNLQPRSPNRPSLKKNKNAGGSGLLTKNDGTTYCLDQNNTQGIVAMRSYPRTGKASKDGERTQNFESREDNCSNSLTSVQKDNLLAEIKVLGSLDTDGWEKRHEQIRRIYDPNGVMATLPTGQGGGVIPKIRENKLISNTLTQAVGRRGHSKEELGYIENNMKCGRLRRLTPKECFRLMGFLNDEINLEGLSDTQRYKLAGNGQDVNMVSLIFKEMFK